MMNNFELELSDLKKQPKFSAPAHMGNVEEADLAEIKEEAESRVMLNQFQSATTDDNFTEMSGEERETRNKLAKYIKGQLRPANDYDNPTASLMNFCELNLSFKVDFRPSKDASTPTTMSVYFPLDAEAIATSTLMFCDKDPNSTRKKKAKAEVSKMVFAKLNNDEVFLDKYVKNSVDVHIQKKKTEYGSRYFK